MRWASLLVPGLLAAGLLVSTDAAAQGRTDGPTVDVSEEGVRLDIDDAELAEVIDLVAELTGRNVLFDDRVRGKVTLISPDRITIEETWRVFEAILQTKGFTTVEGPGGIVKIVPVREAKESPIETSTPDRFLPNRDRFITRLIPLRYVKADAISNTLRQLVSSNANMVAYGPTNTIILTDTAANIRRLLTIIDQIDVKTYQEQIKVIPIEYADAGTLATQLEQIFVEENAATQVRRAARARPAAQQAPASVSVESVTGQIGQPRFITDERTNSIIVIAPQPTIRVVENLVSLLDYKRQGSGRVHVYRLQNADAEEMAQTLQNLSGAPRPAATPGAAAGAGGRQLGAAAIAALAEGVQITADAPTNSLIVLASAEGFAAVRDVVQALDVRRPQVMVDALILEIDVDDSAALGGGLLYQSLLDDNDGARITIGTNTGLGDNPFGALANEVTDPGPFTSAILGRTITVRDESGNLIELPVIQGILQARGTDNDTNIVSAPTILTADNEEAQIVVGQNIPVITSRVQSAAGTTGATDLATSQNVERQDVGLTLRVTPQISEGDTVRLEIFEEISDVLTEDPDLGPTTSKRTVENTVYVKDGETVLIGGIIADRQTETLNKVPFLGDIPILGWAFKSSTDRIVKTNLLVVLTPRIVRDPEDLRRLTIEHRERFRASAGDILEYDEEEQEARQRALAAGISLPLDPNPVRRELDQQTDLYPVEQMPELRRLNEEAARRRQEEMERKAAAAGGTYLVQLAFFRRSGDAVSLLTELMDHGYDGTVLSRRVGEEVVHYVELGPYVTAERAQQVAREVIASTGFPAEVVIER